jgi:glycosyltransferase involved in cell wall biosynthesis
VKASLFVPGPGPLVEDLTARGIRVEIGAPTRKLAWGEMHALAARLRGTCDVVHAHGPRAAFWAAPAAKLAGVPRLICTIHELRWRSLPRGPRRTLWVAFEFWAMRRADRLIVLSRDSQAAVGARFPGLASRLIRIPGSIPLLHEPSAIPMARPGATEGPMRILTVGRLDFVKRHDRLLEAIAMATAQGARVELHVAGDGPLRSDLAERTRALGLESCVRWLGPVGDVPRLLAGGHVFANASMTEAFPLALLEAMSAGLPIVCCDNGGARELVEEGACGVVVPSNTDPETAQGLARAFIELAADPALRVSLGAAAAVCARESFSPARMARATASVYRGEAAA